MHNCLRNVQSNIAHWATYFRFLQAFGPALVQIPVAPESLDEKQHEAQLAREKAGLEEAKVLVSREENKWLKHKADAQAWKRQSEAQRAAFKEEERKQNQAIIEQEMNLRYPGRDLKHPDHMHTFVNASIDDWVMDSTAAREDTYTVWMVNLSIPGYVFMHSALTAIVKATESISNLPERTCAIILCPNTGTFGDNYSDASIMNAAHDVEDLLKDPDLGIMYLPISMTFDEAYIPVQSQRPGQHPAFMVLSSATKPDGKPKSHFALSKLWIRRSVTQLPV
jgi:hypothetical protein